MFGSRHWLKRIIGPAPKTIICILLAVAILAPAADAKGSGVHIGQAKHWRNPHPAISGSQNVFYCDKYATHCRKALLETVNAGRLQYNLAPLTLDSGLTYGRGSCIGAQGHARHMSQEGFISHDDFPVDIVGCSSPLYTGGENVGQGPAGYSVWQVLMMLHTAMMSEPAEPIGCTDSHRCNILSPSYTRIGIGIFRSPVGVWLSEDFVG